MCTSACLQFGRKALLPNDVSGRDVLEVGAYDVNGSIRSIASALGPARYVGVDITPGPGVDELCDARQLVGRFGRESFDVVITTEMFEHVRDWREVLSNVKGVLRPNGVLLLTTRSRGYPYHAAPHDYWRYELADMRLILADMDVELVEADSERPGVLVRARKTSEDELDLSTHRLYSIVTGRRQTDVTNADIVFSYLRSPRRLASALPERVKGPIRNAIGAVSR